MKDCYFDHPEIELIGNEKVTLRIDNTGCNAQVVLMNDPGKGWQFGYQVWPYEKNPVILFNKCQQFKIHDELRNHGRYCSREFLIEADGKILWGKYKKTGDYVDNRKIIQLFCESHNIPYEYTVSNDTQESKDDSDIQ